MFNWSFSQQVYFSQTLEVMICIDCHSLSNYYSEGIIYYSLYAKRPFYSWRKQNFTSILSWI